MHTATAKIAAAVIALLAAAPAGANRLNIDGWSDRQNVQLNQWVSRSSDATRPCSESPRSMQPPQVRGARAGCRVERESGRISQRQRSLNFVVPGARWNGTTILALRYEQDFALEERMVYHDSMSYILEAPCSKLLPHFREWWKSRKLNTPDQTDPDGKIVIEYEAGIETLEPRGTHCEFRSEFYE